MTHRVTIKFTISSREARARNQANQQAPTMATNDFLAAAYVSLANAIDAMQHPTPAIVHPVHDTFRIL